MTAAKKPISNPDCNTRLWDVLAKTDPKHTKPFTRPGGFKGTATKPIWMDYRMTEQFGPCGIGWGTRKPDYTVVTANSATLVYCIVELWYIDDGKEHSIWGVGGDKVFDKYPDDEAFKKAFTDAEGNAMKRLGVCADIHMGLFEDSKYVAAMREEYADPSPSTPPESKPLSLSVLDIEAKTLAMEQVIPATKTLTELAELWARNAEFIGFLKSNDKPRFDLLTAMKNKRKDHFDNNRKAS